MSLEQKLAVLKTVADELNKEGLTWCLGASLLLYFKGLTDDFHDIDLMVLEKDADRVQSVFSRLEATPVPTPPNPKYKTKQFFEYTLDSTEIDVLCGFVIVFDGKEYDCSLKEDQIEEYTELGSTLIPLHSLKLWKEYYRLMGRSSRVELLTKAGI